MLVRRSWRRTESEKQLRRLSVWVRLVDAAEQTIRRNEALGAARVRVRLLRLCRAIGFPPQSPPLDLLNAEARGNGDPHSGVVANYQSALADARWAKASLRYFVRECAMDLLRSGEP